MRRASLFAALFALLLAAPAAAQDPALETAKEEAGQLPTPVAQFTSPVGRLELESAELLAAAHDQPVRFTLTLDRDVERGVMRIALPRRWRDVPASGLKPSSAPRGRAVGRATDAVEIVLDGASAGDVLTAEVRDRGIPAGTYELPVTLSEGGGAAKKVGRLELVLYARSREQDEQPWRDVRALTVSDAPGEQSETFVTVVPGNPNRLIAGANGGFEGYSAWISDDGGETWVERVMPGNTLAAPGQVSGAATLNNCCDPMSAADAAGNLWYGGLDREDAPGKGGSHIIVGRVPAGTNDFVNTVALDSGTTGTQDKPMMTIDNHPSSPTRGRLYVVWNEPSGGGINVVVSFCDTRPGGVANVARCDNADNWTDPATVTKGGPGSYIYADVAVAPNGTAYVTWWNYSAANAIQGATCSASCDAAGGWSPTTTIALLDATSGPIPFACPILAQPGGRASTNPNVEVAGKDGRVYVTWSDLRTGSGSTRCDDNVAPAATHLRFDSVVKTAAGALPTTATPATRLLADAEDPNSDDWFPWIAVDQSSGVAYVAFYSTREDATRKKTHFYARAVGADGALGPLVRVSKAQSDFSGNTCCKFGNDYGDYAGLDATNGIAFPIWSEKSTISGEAVLDAVALPRSGDQAQLRAGAASVSDPAPGGDADGIAEPGEVVTVSIPLANDGSGPSGAATGTLTTSSPKVRIPRATSGYGSVAAGATAPGDYRVHLPDDIGCGVSPSLKLAVDHPDGSVLKRYSFQTGGSTASTASTDVPVGIPDPGQGESTITMPELGAVGDVDVAVNVSHTWVGDLRMAVAHPDGTVVPLEYDANDPNNSGDNFTNTVFDDEALNSFGGSAPFTGSFRPYDPLSALDAKPWAGTWTLIVVDSGAGDTGSITGWSLRRRTCSAPVPNAKPVTALAGPATAAVGQAVTLTADASDPDGAIAQYEWDLDGDGGFETDTKAVASTSAVFASAGVKTVKVRVTDEEGATGEASKQVTVGSVTPAPTATPTPPRAVAPFIALVKPGATLRARKGRFSVALRGCAGCKGALVLETATKVRAKRGAKARKIRLASVSFTVGADGTITVKVKLSKKNQALLKRLRRISLNAKLSVADAAGAKATGSGKLKLRG